MGGMASLRRLLLDHLLAGERQNDRVQESLGNVVAAHAVQTYLGSYGPMIHPVGACATAAVSLEVAHDKITSGGALAVLAGGFDDLTPEGMLGFADMGATASSEELEAMGLAPHEASRANDVRRAGFVEAQGGGAQLVVRGDVALALGLPGARRARLRGQLRRRPARLDPGRRHRRAGERARAPRSARTPRPDRRRHRRRLQARHLDRDERPRRGRPARAPPGRARPHARQPAARRLPEDGHRPRQGRRRRLAARRRAAHARDRRRPRQPQPGERRPARARQPPPRARRPPDPPRRAAAGRADHLARLRPRLRRARDRAPRHVPREPPARAARRLPRARRPPPRPRRPPPPRDAPRPPTPRPPPEPAPRPRRRGHSPAQEGTVPVTRTHSRGQSP